MPVLVNMGGSLNDNALTSAAKYKVLEGITAAGGEAEFVHLNGRAVNRCLSRGNGWGICGAEGRSVLSDDFADIHEKLVVAKGIVWITPAYWHDLAENLKCFLDRLRRCETARNHFLKGKEYLLAACAGGTGLGVIQRLHNLEEILNHMWMIVVEHLPVIRFI